MTTTATTTSSTPLPSAIARYLAALSLRRRKLSRLRGLGLALAVAVVGALVACLLDRIFRLPGALRLVILSLHVGAVVSILVRALWRWYAGADDPVETSRLAERLDPTLPSQLLSTATSRVVGREADRGSADMLAAIVADANAAIADRDPVPLLPTRLAIAPWLVAAGTFAIAAGLVASSWLSLPRLAARYALPLADISPVTTTRLSVLPGSAGVPQNEPLIVNVTAERLSPGAPAPRLHVSFDGGTTWSRYPLAVGDSGYVYRFDSLGQDARYFVTGGDATSPTFDLRVLRKPLVDEFRVRYVYPKYTGRPPLTVTNRTGLIEALTGTEATVTIVASEPLDGAALDLFEGGKDKPPRVVRTERTLDESSRQVKFVVERNADYTVSLTSARGVRSDLPTRYAVRALPDRPPLVRVPDVGQDARPGPRDLMPVTYQALDDYGLAEVVAVVRVNGGQPLRIGLKVQGDPRRQEQTYPLDVAPLDAKVGDALAVTIEARDGLGQWSASPALSALVSPRAIDLNAHQRVVELAAAHEVAARLVGAWENVQKAVHALATTDATDGPVARRAMSQVLAVADVNRGLMNASESAAVLRQSLLRTTARSGGPEMSVAVAAMLDDAQLELLASERLLGLRTAEAAKAADVEAPLATARRLRDALATVATGQRATAAQAERENVAAAKARSDEASYPQALKEGVKRLETDLAQSLRSLGVDPGAGDVAEQLKRKAEAAEELVRTYKSVDFASASGAWSKQIAGPHQPTGFDERLAIAAQAESVRPDADLVRARDVSVSSQAAGRIERNETPPATRPTDPLPRELFPASMLALQRWHEVNRPMESRPSSQDVAERDRVATEGRRRMNAWAGTDEGWVAQATDAAATPAEDDDGSTPETLAIDANAAAVKRDYSAVKRLDRELAQATKRGDAQAGPTGAPATEADAPAPYARTMAAAERIDSLAAKQTALAAETGLAEPDDAGAIAGKQDEIGDAIADVHDATRPEVDGADDPDWRQEATAAIAAAQAQLAAMPQALASVARADAVRRDATERAKASLDAATAAAPEQRDALDRIARQADRDVAEASRQLALVAEPVKPSVAESMSARLGRYRPPTEASVEAIERELLPALRAVAQSLSADDASSLDRASAQTRKAIERVQAALAKAQDDLVERDPLVAAKWFSRAASAALRETPPDMVAARRHQQSAGVALSKAWDRSIHAAANQRLAGVPAFASVFNLFPNGRATDAGTVSGGMGVGENGAAAGAAHRVMSLVPAVRQWGLMRPIGGQPTDAVRRDPDPPGFEEPIRLYFEALGKMKEGGK